MSNIDISIIIVNWNTCEATCNCLWSILNQTVSIKYEIILIDNASSDESVEVIQHSFPDVKLVENNCNCGFATANNQGMEIASGRYMLLLNSDTIVLDGAIQKAIAFADQHLDAGLIGCRIQNPDRTLQPNCFMYPSLSNMLFLTFYLNKLFPKSRFFGRERMTWWNHDQVKDVEAIMGAFMLARKEAVDQVGMMDEDYFMYAEETDWCCRFKKAGWRVLFTPDAQIIHLGGQSSKHVKIRSTVQLWLGILQFFYKHRGRLAFLAACVLISLFFAIRIPLWIVAFAVKPSDKDRKGRIIAYFLGIWKVWRLMVNPSVQNFKA